ncbi:TPA: hypothetical protein DDZ86_00290 [Candidatus Dependentiae bacterium]|nr:MAG: hypothetical protein UW09_C0002G0064 [candidate division TM6 bacterium GW2011_GWF2_43_87]HBL98067.1 hypothetical protein [Candidatus Dependentiae bacterium]
MIKKSTLGMTLIEISIALMIASMMSIALFSFLRNTTKVSQTVDAVLDYTEAIPLAYDQLERDISAIYAPDVLYERKPPSQSKKKGAAGKKGAPATPPAQAAQTPSASSSDTEPKPIAFYSKIEGKRLLTMSFITTTRLVGFRRKDPYRMQVLYRTMPDENSPELLKLVRQQSPDIRLPLKKFEEGVPSFTLMRRIKTCSMRLLAPKIKPKQKTPPKDKSTTPPAGQQGPQKGPQKNQPPAQATANKSPADQKAKEKEEEKKLNVADAWIPAQMKKELNVLIPAYVEIEGIFVDGTGARERPFKFVYKIQSFEEHADRMRNR